MKTKKTKEAVSLIVLVLTIVIMIILAGVIIINLNNSGIIDRAKNAVSETNLKNMQELANVAWGEAYLAIKGEKTPENLKSTMLEKLKGKGVSDEELAKYEFNVTTGGVSVGVYNGWKRDGFKLVRGNQTIEIGDTINYTPTGANNPGWKVLGVDEQGNLLIISDVSPRMAEITGAGEVKTDYGQETWPTALDLLQDACNPYGNGEGAIAVRSINVEDIDYITGYDKTIYGKGKINEYGNEVTFTWYKEHLDEQVNVDVDGDGIKEEYVPAQDTYSIKYTSDNGNGTLWEIEYVDGEISDEIGLEYYDGVPGFAYAVGEETILLTIDDLMLLESGTKLATIKNNAYNYYLGDFNLPEKVLSMLDAGIYYQDEEDPEYVIDDYYYLASRYSSYSDFGMFLMAGKYLSLEGSLWYTNAIDHESYFFPPDDYTENGGFGVRPVVTLSKDLQLTGSSKTGWSY